MALAALVPICAAIFFRVLFPRTINRMPRSERRFWVRGHAAPHYYIRQRHAHYYRTACRLSTQIQGIIFTLTLRATGEASGRIQTGNPLKSWQSLTVGACHVDFFSGGSQRPEPAPADAEAAQEAGAAQGP
jgi:hypothetical protein